MLGLLVPSAELMGELDVAKPPKKSGRSEVDEFLAGVGRGPYRGWDGLLERVTDSLRL